MSDSCTCCTTDSWSSWAASSSPMSPLATMAITAALSAAAGSMATAWITRRRRRRRRRRYFDDDINSDQDEAYQELTHLMNNRNRSPIGDEMICGDDGAESDYDVRERTGSLEFRDSLATTLTSSMFSQDNNCLPQQQQPQQLPKHQQQDLQQLDHIRQCCEQPQPQSQSPDQQQQHDNNGNINGYSNGDSCCDDNDQVSSLREVSRGISQRHYNPKRSSLTLSNEGNASEGGGSACECRCTCNACMSCERIEPAEFRPASLIMPSRRRGSRASRRSSFPNLHLPRRSSLTLDDSLKSEDGLSGLDTSVNRRLSRASSHTTILEEESYISETELKFKGEEGFDEIVTNVAQDLPDSLNLLRRTRAISALSNRLMAAPDEATCIEEVTTLLVLMFGVERVSFAMLTGSDHFLLKRVTVRRKKLDPLDIHHSSNTSTASISSTTASSSFDLVYLNSDYRRPMKGTAVGECARTLKESYTPETKSSTFDTHKVFYKNGMNTVLVSPILVNGNKCAGCILLTRREEDGYKKGDRVLISDIGMLLGANIYAKRLLKAAEEVKVRSREMLHSFIPPKVLEKIECYWDANSDEYKSRKNTSLSSSTEGSVGSNSATGGGRGRSNSWYVAQSEWTEAEVDKDKLKKKGGIEERIEMIRKMNRLENNSDDDNVGVIVSTQGMDFAPTSTALYAESVNNVCIVFTDIVGFSRIAMDIQASEIMDMLQNLFNRFDELCDIHGVLKLETIGDAYICATNLMEDDDDGAEDAAIRALAMAKDMVIAATNVTIPKSMSGARCPFETLEIRAGIHVGDIMCGVLGQRMPKFTTCGSAVNMAARMEQTSAPSRIRVTKDFHDLVGEAETGWMEKEEIPIKNMGQVETYLLGPMYSQQ